MGSVTMNGKTFVGNNIQIINGVLSIDGVQVESGLGGEVRLVLDGNIGSVKSSGSVTVNGNVNGNVDAGNSVHCGDVGGDVEAGNSVSCKKITGSVDAGGSVRMSN